MNKHLHVLWTNNDPVCAEHMLMMYVTNAMRKAWWDKVTVIIWGSTQTLLCHNSHMQSLLDIAREAGVEFSACIACARQLGTVDKLNELSIETKPWGIPLTELIQSDAKLLTI